MIQPSKPFLNQRVLVTGASSGIGFAVAQALALAGAHIHAVARHWKQAPPAWHTHCADLSVESDVKRLAQELLQDANPLDVVVHSAGAFALGSVADFDINELDKLYAINVRAEQVERTLVALAHHAHDLIVDARRHVFARVR